MSNKLDEVFNKLSIAYYHRNNESKADAFMDGFDAAIALDLPVKYNNWANTHSARTLYHQFVKETGFFAKADKLLYKYWLDNIYNPET